MLSGGVVTRFSNRKGEIINKNSIDGLRIFLIILKEIKMHKYLEYIISCFIRYSSEW